MTELERWMDDHPPLADTLTAEETAALRAKVLARRPRMHVLRGWRVMAAAAALCLVAAGAVVLGLFHPMSAANETNALVQKYGVVLDEPLTAEINGRTVTVRALLRGQYTLRVLYDVDNAQGMHPGNLVWDTASFTLLEPEGETVSPWDYDVRNAMVGPISGYAVGSWETRNAVSESDSLSCFVDIPLLYDQSNTRTLYIGDLTNYDAKASVEITLPDAPTTLTAAVEKSITLKGGHWFHYDLTDEEAEAFPDIALDIEEIRIEPLAVSVIGTSRDSIPLGSTSRFDVQSRVKMFRADGTELTYGWDGEFYKGQYGRITKNSGKITLRVDSYDIIDPQAVAYVEIDGERFEME